MTDKKRPPADIDKMLGRLPSDRRDRVKARTEELTLDDLVPPNDLAWSTDRPNPGGQQVGVYAGVTVIHLPTGMTCHVNVARSQLRNKRIAVEMIAAALTSPHFRQD